MNWFLNGIFLLTCYPILLIMYFMLKNANDRNGYCFGTTLKKELRNDATVETITAEYKKNLKTSMIVLAIVPLPAFFIPYTSIIMTIWMMWILVICFLPMVWYAKANKQIMDLKQERGWQEVSEVTYTDLKIAAVPRKVKFTTFLPCIVLSVIPTIIAFATFQGKGYGVYAWIVATFAACTLLFYACAIWTDKQKITVISVDSNVNLNYARAKKQVWKNYWLICTWVNTVFTWFMLLLMWMRDKMVMGIIIGSIIYGVVIIVASVYLMKKLRVINETYEEKRTVVDAVEDDKNWIYGLIYYNKNDNHLMAESRMGNGTTLNMAKGIGIGTYVFSGIAMLALPVMCIWMIMMEFTPLDTKVVDDQIVCQHLTVEYEIPLEDIESYEVVTELPEMIKVNGTGMDNILSGTYEIYREGMFETFLNPQNNLFIKIVTADETYYISGQDDEGTKEILAQLEEIK